MHVLNDCVHFVAEDSYLTDVDFIDKKDHIYNRN
jgi:hypothetical protein